MESKFVSSSRIIEVTVPASVSYDLEQSFTVIKNVLDRLGCPTCHSGVDIRFTLEDRFIVNPKTLDVIPNVNNQF